MAALTTRQKEALAAAFYKGGAWYALAGSRAGGSFSRLCDRLAGLGLVEAGAPHPITLAGLIVLRDLRAIKYARHGSMADMKRLDEIETAIAKARGQ